MAGLPASGTQTQQSLKLLVKGFAGFDMRLLTGVVKLSAHRSPSLELVSDPASAAVDVVMIDGKDAQAVAWAKQQEVWLQRQPVVWVDFDGSLPETHTRVSRPVQWMNLPVLLSRAMDDAAENGDSSEAGQQVQMSAPVPAASTHKPATELPVQTASAQANVDQVLVVDDSAAVRGHLSSVLETWGYNVTVADSGEAGVIAVGKNGFSCVLMDVLMPGIDGYDACRRIKAMPNRADTPVVMLTSKSSPFDKIRGKMAGCDAYLTKPVEKARLMEVVAKHARGK